MTQDEEGIFPATYLSPLDLSDIYTAARRVMESLLALLSRAQALWRCWGVSSQGNGVANEHVNSLLKGP